MIEKLRIILERPDSVAKAFWETCFGLPQMLLSTSTEWALRLWNTSSEYVSCLGEVPEQIALLCAYIQGPWQAYEDEESRKTWVLNVSPALMAPFGLSPGDTFVIFEDDTKVNTALGMVYENCTGLKLHLIYRNHFGFISSKIPPKGRVYKKVS